ncbi:MAG: Rhodanese-related sulfurtransferase [Phormidesmis priestleyi Ana]|uniref:Rhodanese-related sulfurtransferase n=1 Tax=Phormidesmis priestleyi Ana TaxID=1666911 RepID=A0A0P8BTV2_9CYAN|nr:MAG: Rhodanese-related sulfurtransferase [Phormidesmis priestleyi Ana]
MDTETSTPNNTSGDAFEAAKGKAADVLETARDKERGVLGAVSDAQDVVGKATPVPTDFDAVSSPSDLNARLNWGEPALSILDVRDRADFNYERIMGAMPMSMDNLVEQAKSSFEPIRDLFIYSDSDENAVEAATQLRSAGFKRVSTIRGGLPAWKAIDGPTEGQFYIESPIPGLK